MASPLPGSSDRAWNDPPPMLASGPPQSGSSAPPPSSKRILSKRVAYTCQPADSSPPKGSVVSRGGLLPSVHDSPNCRISEDPLKSLASQEETKSETPPMPPANEMSFMNLGSVENPKQLNTGQDVVEELLKKHSDVSYEVQKEEIVNKMEQCFRKVSESLQKRTADDVRKRLDILKNNIYDKKMSEAVISKVYCLAKELEDGNHENAHQVHLHLMMAHVGEVSHWMVGVKHIIQAFKAEDKEPTNEAIKEPLSEENS